MSLFHCACKTGETLTGDVLRRAEPDQRLQPDDADDGDEEAHSEHENDLDLLLPRHRQLKQFCWRVSSS